MNSRVLGSWIRECHGFYLVHPYGLGDSMASRMKPGWKRTRTRCWEQRTFLPESKGRMGCRRNSRICILSAWNPTEIKLRSLPPHPLIVDKNHRSQEECGWLFNLIWLHAAPCRRGGEPYSLRREKWRMLHEIRWKDGEEQWFLHVYYRSTWSQVLGSYGVESKKESQYMKQHIEVWPWQKWKI